MAGGVLGGGWWGCVCGRGHEWWGCVWQGEVYVVGGVAGGIHGRGWHAWQWGVGGRGACMAGTCMTRGACMAGGAWCWACVAEGGSMAGGMCGREHAWHTVNERAVHILLECILVNFCWDSMA